MTPSGHGSMRRGYTLVEMLIATTLTLVMMGGIATVFGMIGTGVSSARAGLEMADALRATAQKLRADLDGVTVTTSPPRRPDDNEGYLEYTEGPMGPVVGPGYVARNLDRPRTPVAGDSDQIPYYQDSTIGDADDVLMFTSRSRGAPFIARFGGSACESHDAEIAWFVRGSTLYRRVLLVRPDLSVSAAAAGFFARNDVSVRNESGNLYANSLADLTKPENRFAHQSGAFPYHPHRVAGWANPGNPAFSLARLNLPLLQECSDAAWVAGGPLPTVAVNIEVETIANPSAIGQGTASAPFDAWTNPHPWELPRPNNNAPHTPAVERETGVVLNSSNYPMGTRFGEDVVLSNVMGFDVRAWDPSAPILRGMNDNGTPSNLNDDSLIVPTVVVLPGDGGYPLAFSHLLAGNYLPIGYGAYVDLGYAAGVAPNQSVFSGNGSQTNLPRVYDTWSLHYESDGVNQDGDGTTDEGTNGFDDDGNGVVDDVNEMEAPPPYAAPLRGIQIKIRVFEPDSRQIREMTIVHDFLPK